MESNEYDLIPPSGLFHAFTYQWNLVFRLSMESRLEESATRQAYGRVEGAFEGSISQDHTLLLYLLGNFIMLYLHQQHVY